MNYDTLIQNLTILDPYEKIGRNHHQIYGKNLTSAQFVWLFTSDKKNAAPESLYEPQSLHQQKQLQEEMGYGIARSTLTSQDFISEESTIELQKLMRYVDIAPHGHEFIECAYVFSGKCLHRINGENYIQEPGDLIVIPNGYTHALYPEEDCLCLTIKIRVNTFFEMNIPGRANFACPIFFSCRDDLFVRNNLLELWLQQNKRMPNYEQILLQLFQVWMLYISQQYYQESRCLLMKETTDMQILEILNYMMDNFQTITLSSTAKHFHYNAAYLSRFFHEHTGMTFSGMLKEYRLRQAANLLSEYHYKLNEVCEMVGYKDTTQFIRNFKDLYGVTPAKFGKAAKSDSLSL